MKDDLVVSVGIPSYNRPEELCRTLECFTRQTYTNLDIIVSDNCSLSPKVMDICKTFAQNDNRITCFQQNTNIGGTANFQFVLDKARGDYFMWVDDEDEWDETYIEKCLNGFNQDPNIVLVSSLCDMKDTENPSNDFFYDSYSNIWKNTDERVLEISRIAVSGRKKIAYLINGVFKREAITGIQIKEVIGADLLFLVNVSLYGTFYTVPELLHTKKGVTKNIDDYIKYFNTNNISLHTIHPYLPYFCGIIRLFFHEKRFSARFRIIAISKLCILFIIRTIRLLPKFLRYKITGNLI